MTELEQIWEIEVAEGKSIQGDERLAFEKRKLRVRALLHSLKELYE